MNHRKNDPRREVRTISGVELRVTREEGKPVHLRGHAAVFNQIGDGRWFLEKIAPGAFADSIPVDDVRALFNHDANYVLGRNKAKPLSTLELSEDSTGLLSDISAPDTQLIRDMVISPVERGDISQVSFAFETLEDHWEYGKNNEPDIRTLVKVKLYDVSIVTYPFYEGTDVAVRSHDQWRTVAEPKAPWRRELLRRRIKIFDMAAGH